MTKLFCVPALLRSNSKTFQLPAAVVLSFFLITGSSLLAQTNNGVLAGNVLDDTGASLPGAQVTAKNDQTGVSSRSISSNAGDYRLPALAPGTYTVTVTAPKFQSGERTGVVIQVNNTTSLNISLRPGEVTQTITVAANTPSIETQTSDVSTVVNPRQMLQLPLALGSGQMRTPVDFVALVPGTAGGDNTLRIAGGQSLSSDILLDGVTLNTLSGANFDAPGFTPSVDALQEFKVFVGGLPAEFGRTAGGLTSFVTKSGTNQFHGELYDIFRNTDLDANNWFNNGYKAQCAAGDTACADKYRRPDDRKNDYGITLGGPVWIPKVYDGRNKTFFFFSWEQFIQSVGNVNTETVPTFANRNGDFSATLDPTTVLGVNPCTGGSIFKGQIFDPASTRLVNDQACRDSFPGNQIPASRFSKVTQNVLSYAPLPQNNLLLNNFTFRSAYQINITAETIRLDHNFSENDRLFVSYNPHQFNTPCNSAPSYSGAGDPGCFYQNTFLHDARVGYDHIFSPALLNHLGIGFDRFSNIAIATAVNNGQDYPAVLGIANLHGPNFPSFSYGENYTSIGNNENVSDFQNHLQLNDAVSWTTGRHSFKFGFDGRAFQFSRINLIGQGGSFGFSRDQTAATALSTANSGNGFASFLLGDVGSASAFVPLRIPRSDSYYYGVFAQDDYKVSSTLVLNLGLRYDVDLPPREAADDTSIFSPTTPNPGAGGLPGALIFSGSGPGRTGSSSRWANTWFKDVAPRVGFSWAPAAFKQKTAFRGSYGIMYAPMPPTDLVPFSPGFTATPSYSDATTLGGFSPVFNLDSGFPAFSRAVNLDPSQKNNQGVSYIDPSYGRPAMIQLWTFEVQQQLAPDLILNVGYLGQHSTHLSSNLYYPNSISSDYLGLGSALKEGVASNAVGAASPYAGFSGTVAQALRPYPQYLGIGTELENLGQATYNAMLVKIERRFRNGFNLLASYTWSKSLTDADSALPGLIAGSGAQDPFNLAAEKAVSALNVPQAAAISYIYELPFGHGKKFLNNNGLLDKFVGGWQIGGIQSYSSGGPVIFGCATGIPGRDNCIRYNYVSGQSLLSPAALSDNFNPFTDRYYNPAAFSDPNSAARLAAGGGYQFGDLSRVSSLRNPFNLNENFSIIKRIPLTERINLELWGEIFNAFNRHILGAPDANPTDLAFGQVTSSSGPRQVQFRMRVTF